MTHIRRHLIAISSRRVNCADSLRIIALGWEHIVLGLYFNCGGSCVIYSMAKPEH